MTSETLNTKEEDILLETVINSLKESPLFNFSLASKELFHSNFLAWLGTQYPNQFSLMMSEILEIKEYILYGPIKREYKNSDISFKLKNGSDIKSVIIENKVKSIPYKEQLDQYSEKIKWDGKILLSLIRHEDFEGWKSVSYHDLLKMIMRHFAINGSYHDEIIRDYCRFIDALSKISDLISIKDPSKEFYSYYSGNSICQNLNKIRLQDIIIKGKSSVICSLIKEKLGINTSLPRVQDLWNNHIFPVNEFRVGHGFTRNTGLIEIKYKITDSIIIGIQLQGNHYRRIIELKKNLDSHHQNINGILNDIGFSDCYWMNNFSIPIQHFSPNKNITEEYSLVYPKTEMEYNTKGYNSFGNTFFYRSINICKNSIPSIETIINCISEDIEVLKTKINHNS
jgi:hypothetical protein